MYPHERSFVKKIQDKPVVLLGVNSDKDRQELKKVFEKEQITWRSWLDGKPNGPIASRWHVQGWPAIYIIDAEGVIRAKDDQGEFVGHPERLEIAVTLVLAGKKPEVGTRTASKSKKKDPGQERKESVAAATPKKPAEPKPDDDKDQSEQRAAVKLGFAQQLADAGKTAKAIERCKEIIKDYPKTSAAAGAKDLLEKIDK